MNEKAESSMWTILVIEDEGLLRLAVCKALRKRGFSVIEASDGTSGLEMIRAHKDDIDLVLLDVTLPGISSSEVLEEAHKMRPVPRVVITSAYGKEIVDASFPRRRIDYFIRKPFHLSDLLPLLEEALGLAC